MPYAAGVLLLAIVLSTVFLDCRPSLEYSTTCDSFFPEEASPDDNHGSADEYDFSKEDQYCENSLLKRGQYAEIHACQAFSTRQ